VINQILLQQARRDLAAIAGEQLTSTSIDSILGFVMGTENKERQRQHRESMKAKGFHQKTIWLSDQAFKKIENVQKKKGFSRDEAIEFLLLR